MRPWERSRIVAGLLNITGHAEETRTPITTQLCVDVHSTRSYTPLPPLWFSEEMSVVFGLFSISKLGRFTNVWFSSLPIHPRPYIYPSPPYHKSGFSTDDPKQLRSYLIDMCVTSSLTLRDGRRCVYTYRKVTSQMLWVIVISLCHYHLIIVPQLQVWVALMRVNKSTSPFTHVFPPVPK